MSLQFVKLTAGMIKSFLLTAGAMCLMAGVQAQNGERITLRAGRIAVGEFFRQVERQTGKTIVVRAGTVDDSAVVELPVSGTLEQMLTRALAGSGGVWQVEGDYIIVGTRPKAPEPQPQRPILIERGELRRFVSEAPRGEGATESRTLEAGPFSFESGDKTFRTPGRLLPGAETAAPFTMAERGQRSKLALKSNLLYGGVALAPNLRAEIGLGNRTTLEAGLAYNGWNLKGTVENNKKLVHGVALAEFRYWLCERFDGHYVGVHALAGRYNVSGHEVPMLFEKEFRYQGRAYGAGISYGYTVPLSPRWGVEFNVGVGAMQLKYDRYGCEKCDDLEGSYDKTYFGPTRAGINLVFMIK